MPSVVSAKKTKLAAQQVSQERAGPFTGAVSWSQLKSMGASYVIVGHSETRVVSNETDDHIQKKVRMLLEHRMIPVLCVGESRQEEDGPSSDLGERAGRMLKNLQKEALGRLVIAYEPVWAISTTLGSRPNTPEKTFQAMVYLRRIVTELYGRKNADKTRIIYGGSVTSSNIASFLCEGKIEGVLVGQASLKKDEFLKIVRQASRAKRI